MSVSKKGFRKSQESELRWYSQRPMLNGSQAIDPRPYCNVCYRPPHEPILYYVASVFHPTNQTFNFWTHFIPFLYFLNKYISLIIGNNFVSESYTLPYYSHGFACCIVLFASSLAHMFGDRSLTSCQCCFATDVSCIFLLCYTLRTAMEHYFCTMNDYCTWPYTLVSDTVYGIYLVSCYWAYLFATSRRSHLASYLISVSITVACLIGTFPCFLRFFLDTRPNVEHLSYYVVVNPRTLYKILILNGLSVITYSLQIPERFSPDTFAIVGNSHQLMHILVVASMYFQSNMFGNAVEDIRMEVAKKNIADSVLRPELFQSVIVGLLFVAAFNTFGTMLYWKYLSTNENKKSK